MSQKILFLILLLSAPALACTGCLVSQVEFASVLTTLGGLFILERRRQVQGWKAVCIGLGSFWAGTALGVASNLVFQFHYMLAPFLTVGATLTCVALLGHRCPPRSQPPANPGFTPEVAPSQMSDLRGSV